MNLTAIYTKTASGLRVRKTLFGGLPAQLIKILVLIDGKSSLSTIKKQFADMTEAKFIDAIMQLEKEGYIKIFGEETTEDWDLDAAFSPMEVEEIEVTEDSQPFAGLDKVQMANIEAAQRLEDERKAQEIEAQIRAKEKAKLEALARENAERMARKANDAKLNAKLEAQTLVDIIRAREKARREQASQAKEAESAKERAEQEAKDSKEAKLAEQLKAKQEAEAFAIAEAKAIEEAKERGRLEAERIAIEAEEKRLQLAAKAEEEARVVAELKARQEEEEKTIAEAKERERIAREAEEAKRQLEAKAAEEERLAAELKAKQEAEAFAKAEAKAIEEAKERGRLEAERIAREAEEKRLQLAAKAEEEARVAKELKAKQEAEAAALIAQQEAEARAKAKEEARLEKARIAQEKVDEKARIKAEEAARKEAERIAKAEKKAAQEAEKIANKLAEKQAKEQEKEQEVEHIEISSPAGYNDQQEELVSWEVLQAQINRKKSKKILRFPKLIPPAKVKRATLKGLKWILIFVPITALVLLALMHIVSLNMLIKPIESIASNSLGQKVTVGDVRASLWPQAHLVLSQIKVGNQDSFSIESVQVNPELSTLLDENKTIHDLTIDGVDIEQKNFSLPKPWLANLSKSTQLKIDMLHFKNVKLHINDLELGTFAGDIKQNNNHEWSNIAMQNAENTLSVKIIPQGGEDKLMVSAQHWPLPINNKIVLDETKALGVYQTDKLIFKQIEGEVFGGKFNSSATLDWVRGWQIAGDFNLNKVNTDAVLKTFASTGSVMGKLTWSGQFSSQTTAFASLADAWTMSGDFEILDSKINGVDIPHIIITPSDQSLEGYATHFDKLSGNVQISQGRYSYRNLTLKAPNLLAQGQVDIDESQNITGKINTNLATPSRNFQTQLNLTGIVSNVKRK